MHSASLDIRPLTPERLPDFLAYFEEAAFADNPNWRSCYCQFLHVDHRQVDWATRTGQQNRADACERICGQRMQGQLAYRDGAVVGWCNAAPRSMLAAFAEQTDPDAQCLGQITCFVVAKAQRRSGVATALLAAACEGLRAQGLTLAEASPKAGLAGDAENHFGPLALYEAAGFLFHRTGEHGSVVMRKSLV